MHEDAAKSKIHKFIFWMLFSTSTSRWSALADHSHHRRPFNATSAGGSSQKQRPGSRWFPPATPVRARRHSLAAAWRSYCTWWRARWRLVTGAIRPWRWRRK
ncbi:hypothetical protein ACQJBY_032711 [Aegilops geniculata]